MHNLTRRARVAFLGVVDNFGGGLLMLRPKVAGAVDLVALAAYLNGAAFSSEFVYSKRFKMGQKILRDSLVPRELMNSR